VVVEYVGRAHRLLAWGGLVGAGRQIADVDGVARDEHVPSGPVTQHVHRLVDVLALVTTQIDDRVPLAGPQRLVVAGVAIADQLGDLRRQIGSTPASTEGRHLGAVAERVRDDRAPDEPVPTQHQNPHNRRP
jgi:hypothetical protein